MAGWADMGIRTDVTRGDGLPYRPCLILRSERTPFPLYRSWVELHAMPRNRGTRKTIRAPKSGRPGSAGALSNSEWERAWTAHHEAGHAVAAYRLRPGAPAEGASIVPSGNVLGKFVAESGFDSALRRDVGTGQLRYEAEVIDAYIIELLAGRYAEMRAGCPVRLSKLGASGDDEQVAEYFRHSKTSLAELRKRAARFVAREWKAISAVARELLDRDRLVAEEIEAIIDWHQSPGDMQKALALVRLAKGIPLGPNVTVLAAGRATSSK